MKTQINIVHIRVNKDREKIWAICRLALLKRNFVLDNIYPVADEEEFQETMKKLAVTDAYVLVLDKTTARNRELGWKNRLIAPAREMKPDEVEMDFEDVMEWLIEIEPEETEEET